MVPFNILDYPLCLESPRRLTDIFSWQEHIPFAFALVQLAQPRTVVELGAHKGDSYCAFCQAVQTLNLACSCSAVDSWEGDEEAGFYGPEILEDLRRYHDPLYGSFSQLVKSRFDEALARFADHSIDVLHIDGLHTYDAVHHDFQSWLPKVSAHGVILFHDIEVRDDDFGVWKLWEELTPHYPSFSFHHCNGLGILGVGNDLPKNIAALFALDDKHKRDVAAAFHYLGSRLTIENRLHRKHEQAIQARDRIVQDLARHSENLAAILEEQKNHLGGLIQHGKNLEHQLRDQLTLVERIGKENKGLETRLLTSLEQNSYLAGQIDNLEKVLDANRRHVENLEKILHHPLIRMLRTVKRTVTVRI